MKKNILLIFAVVPFIQSKIACLFKYRYRNLFKLTYNKKLSYQPYRRVKDQKRLNSSLKHFIEFNLEKENISFMKVNKQ